MNNEVQLILKKNNHNLQTSFEGLKVSCNCDKKFLENLQNLDQQIVADFCSCKLNDSNISHHGSTHVNISNSSLTEIPNAIYRLKYLTVLDLSYNSLEFLPKELNNLCNLAALKLSGNKLNSLPKSLKNLQQLKYLDLSYNNFVEVPDVLFYGLWILKYLDLSHNKISNFDESPGCFNKLFILYLANNFLTKLPIWIFDSLCQLQILDISDNPLSIDSEIYNYCNTGIFYSLKLLKIENCNICLEKIQILSMFTNLNSLHLGNKKQLDKKQTGKNYFGNLEVDKLRIFKKTKYLYLENVHIASLPNTLACFINIELLDLSDNLLSWLPEEFCNLANLKILYLTHNELLFLPRNIEKLLKLEQIHLGHNKLSQLPENFYKCNNLKIIDLYDNELDSLNVTSLKDRNLEGFDIGLNCLDCDYLTDLWYKNLKNSFRKMLNYTDRYDNQKVKQEKIYEEVNDDATLTSPMYSLCSFGSEFSDIDDTEVSIAPQSCSEVEEWVKNDSDHCGQDDYFDPNEIESRQQSQSSWEEDFKKNFCPGNSHVPSVKKFYAKNVALATKNESVEEGQFDSD